MVDVSNRVLFITNDFGPRAGGIETFVIGLIERLPFGSVIVYTSSQGDSSVYDQQWLARYGTVVIRDRSKILLPTPRVARAISRIVKSEKITVAAFGAAAPLGVLSGQLRRSGVEKIVALTHGHEVWWAKVFPFNFALRLIARKADVLTYLGDFTRTAISGALRAEDAQRMIKIAPGINTEHFSPQSEGADLRKRLGLENKAIIVSVGRLVHRKGQDRLIQAMPQILAVIPSAHLLLVGEGPYEGHLRKIVIAKGLQESVSFVGRVQYDQLPIYFSAGNIFAMPSRSRFFGLEVEGLGIVYLEASACGIAVIAGNSGGAPDAVLEGKTGLVVDGTDVEEIADACIALLNDPQRAKVMGDAGRRWAIDAWRWEIWAAEFERLLFTA